MDGLGVASFSLGPDHGIDLAARPGLSLRWLMDDPLGGASGVNLLQHARRAVEAGDADVVVLVAGDNLFTGLSGGFSLAKAGASVCLVEGCDRVGGFIASDTLSDPGYVHDTFSSWHPLFVSGAAYAAIGPDLHRHGLEYCNIVDPEAPLFASVAADGRVTTGYRDPERTASAFAEPEDRDAYLAMVGRTESLLRVGGRFLDSELRDVRRFGDAVRAARRTRRHDREAMLRDIVASGRSWTRRDFRGAEVDHLWMPWLLHAGLSPDAAGGGVMGPVFAATTHSAGLPVVRGGAGKFIGAFEAVLEELGVTIVTGTTVDRIEVVDGRARGVLAGDRRIGARTAVLATMTPERLYGELLADVDGLAEQRREARQFRFGRAAMQLHVALSAPLPWRDGNLGRTPLIHLTNGSDSIGIACAEAEAGLLPRRPTVVVGQQCVLDRSRAPSGAATLWIQLPELPYAPIGDAAGQIDADGTWNPSLTASYVERVLDSVEQHAPGLRDLVVSTLVHTPMDLERVNPNAVAGDPYGGSLELDQSLMWRPGIRTGRHKTAVAGVWHIGASTHPGPGLSGASGYMVARSIASWRRSWS